jgi:hypothetical protein
VHWAPDLAPALRVILARDGYAEAVRVLLTEHYGWSEVTAADDPEIRGYHDDRFTAVPDSIVYNFGIVGDRADSPTPPSG